MLISFKGTPRARNIVIPARLGSDVSFQHQVTREIVDPRLGFEISCQWQVDMRSELSTNMRF